MDTTEVTGREYLRVSVDRSGRSRSVDEQHDENLRAAASRGVALGKHYEDTMSASRYSTKTRDEFDLLLADLGKGRFGADELWLWEPSRGSRRVSEWVLLIEACERAKVVIFVTTHGRTYDPANPRDRRSLLEDAVDSEYESSKVSARAKRAAAANAEAGLPHGPTPYGYRRIYHPQTRRLERQEPHPVEAPIVVEMFDRLSRGHSLRAIATDLEARGVLTRTEKPISPRHVRDLLMSPTYAGIRTHNANPGEGRQRWSLDGAVKGTWEPLVSEETYFAVRHVLTRPERKTTRPGRAHHLLSFIAVCDVCGGPLAVTRRSDGRGPAGTEQYQCHRAGHVRVSKGELDEVAEKRLLDFLANPDVHAGVASAGQADDQLQAVRNALSTAKGELEDLRAGVIAGRLSVANLTVVEPALVARVTTLEQEERDLSTPSVLHGLIQPGEDVGDRWKAAEASTRREVARTLLTPAMLGQLRVLRRPRDAGPRHVPAATRLRWVTQSGA